MLYSKETNFTSHQLAYEILKNFDAENRLVFSTTWTNTEDTKIIYDYIKDNPKNKVIVISTFDQDLYSNIKGENIVHISCKDFCFWLMAIEKFFLKYQVEDLIPNNFKYKFICYQRKVYEEREILYQLLKNSNGIVTLGNKEFNEINTNLPPHSGYSEVGGETTIPNDIYSLGNIDIWNKSFLNVVVETTQDIKRSNLFFSEKTFKPIIGMRPFISYGHPKSSEKLKEMGFETFDDDFCYVATDDYSENAKRIKKVIDNLNDLDLLYQKLYPKILHNKNHLTHAIFNEKIKLKKLIENI